MRGAIHALTIAGARFVVWLLLLIAASAPFLVSCRARADTSTRRLEDVVLQERFVVSRFTHQTAWHGCAIVDSSGVIPRVRCAAAPTPGSARFDQISRAITGVRSSRSTLPTPNAARLGAFADLPWVDSDPRAVERIAATLARETEAGPPDAATLNDLAAAYVALAEKQQRLRPMLAALDAVERALAIDSSLVPSLFNRALILERLYLIETANAAWTRYLGFEHDEHWRREAERHRARIRDRLQSQASPLSIDSLFQQSASQASQTIAAHAVIAPEAAREFGLSMLSMWGAAVTSGHRDRASRMLAFARVVATGLTSAGGDAMLSREVALIDSLATIPHASDALARAYVSLANGERLFHENQLDKALPVLEAVAERLRVVRSPSTGLALYYAAASRVNVGDYRGGDALLRRMLQEASFGLPSLSGRAMLGLAVSQLRRGNYDGAAMWARNSLGPFQQARDNRTIGFAYHLLAESLGLTGRTFASHDTSYRAIQSLSPFRGSGYLYNQLARLAADARGEGLRHASLAIMDEVLDVARAMGQPDGLVVALCSRARDRLAVGDGDLAARDMADAERWTSKLPSGRGLDRVRAIVLLTRGVVLRTRDAHAALGVLTRAVEELRPFETDPFMPMALYEAALAARQTSDSAQARALLEEAVTALEHQASRLRTAEDRIAFSETAENAFDTMISMELARKRDELAFDYLERSRRVVTLSATGLSPALPTGREAGALNRITRNLPNDLLLVEYALLQDGVAIWAASRQEWRSHFIRAPRDSISKLVDRLSTEMSSSTLATPPALGDLFEILLRPVAKELGGIRRLAIVPDRDLHRVPFVALWDREQGQYALERYEISTIPSAEFLLSSLRVPVASRRGRGTLVIGEPRVESKTSRLGPLPGAQREAKSIADLYTDSKLVAGRDATREHVVSLLPHYSAIHFAGHAVSDLDRPEFSYLALAADSSRDGELHAWEIGRLRLSSVQVVVLAACTTLSARTTRNGAMAGLAYSFLRAGVPATISTLWDVNDDQTSELLVAFHKRLARGESVPHALRFAQLEAIGSSAPLTSAPRTWAAFTYTGP